MNKFKLSRSEFAKTLGIPTDTLKKKNAKRSVQRQLYF